MSASHSAEGVQKVLQGVLPPPLDYSPEGCSDSTTPGRICEPCMQLNAVNEGINKLLKIQAEVKERVNQHHDPLSPLPVEIASHIFAIYTEDVNSNFNPKSPIIERGGPLLLGAVSKFWSDNLWTKAKLTKEWLDRSRQLPLHLSLVYPAGDSNEPAPGPLIPLFNVVQNVSPRWHKLVLGISPILYTTFLGEVYYVPSLKTLKLLNIEDWEEQGEFCLDTPLLKHLDIQVSILIFSVSINWSSLTTLEATHVTMGEYFSILRICGGLECFRLRVLVGDTQYPLPTTPFTHSALRELYLETNWAAQVVIDPSELASILNLVAFPSLKKFGYKPGMENLFPTRAIPSIFNRSRCQLTHFDPSGCIVNGTSDDLIFILSDLPTITHFKLEDTYRHSDNRIMTDKLLRKLIPIHHSEFTHTDRLLPRLESLEFLGYKGFSWGCLASVVSATAYGDPNLLVTSARPVCTNSIPRISFRICLEEEMEHIDAQSLARFKDAHRAGIFHYQALRGFFAGGFIDPFLGDDLS